MFRVPYTASLWRRRLALLLSEYPTLLAVPALALGQVAGMFLRPFEFVPALILLVVIALLGRWCGLQRAVVVCEAFFILGVITIELVLPPRFTRTLQDGTYVGTVSEVPRRRLPGMVELAIQITPQLKTLCRAVELPWSNSAVA
jgi:hypothetical protein